MPCPKQNPMIGAPGEGHSVPADMDEGSEFSVPAEQATTPAQESLGSKVTGAKHEESEFSEVSSMAERIFTPPMPQDQQREPPFMGVEPLQEEDEEWEEDDTGEVEAERRQSHRGQRDSPGASPRASRGPAESEGASVEAEIYAPREDTYATQQTQGSGALDREGTIQTHMTEDMQHRPPLRAVQEAIPEHGQVEGSEGKFSTWEPQTMAQKMRFFEAMENWKALEDAGAAIETLSRSTGTHTESLWDSAANWSLVITQGGHVPLLKAFGYNAVDDKQWRKAPMDGGPTVKFSVVDRESHAYHTWYMVDCELQNAAGSGEGCLKWRAPRRLCQLRWDLHDRVKHWMGHSYQRLFQNTPFAKLGGPPGTQARLHAWLETLATVINNGTAPPRMAALALRFLQAPLPPGFLLKDGRPAPEAVGDLDNLQVGRPVAGDDAAGGFNL